VDFELFRPELNAALSYSDRTEGGRPPFDPVLMFKILVIQATNITKWFQLSEQDFRFDRWASAGVKLPSGRAAA
jgi:hypothetical protein